MLQAAPEGDEAADAEAGPRGFVAEDERSEADAKPRARVRRSACRNCGISGPAGTGSGFLRGRVPGASPLGSRGPAAEPIDAGADCGQRMKGRPRVHARSMRRPSRRFREQQRAS